jgi:hypothetical protein
VIGVIHLGREHPLEVAGACVEDGVGHVRWKAAHEE